MKVLELIVNLLSASPLGSTKQNDGEIEMKQLSTSLITSMLVIFVTFLAFTGQSGAAAEGADKADICHRPDGSNTYVPISVSVNAVESHFANHGDSYQGAFYGDTDGDGFGDPNGATDICPNPGFIANATDCNDSDPAINPSATELPADGVDNNCDTKIDDCVSVLLHCYATSPVLQTFCGAGSHSVASGEIIPNTQFNASYVLLTPAVASVQITSCQNSMTATIPPASPDFCALTGGASGTPRFNDQLCDLNITPN
jgi:hypothetical protein